MKVDLKTVLSFATVADELSFSRAARRLNIDQSRLSRHIRALEDRLGVSLFSRTTRNVSLTEEGRRLLIAARPLERAVKEVEKAIELLQNGLTDQLRVGVLFSLGADKRSALFEAFARRFPHIRLVIQYGPTRDLLALLDRGMLDVIFANDPFDRENRKVIRFQHHPLAVILPEEDPLTACDQVPLDQLVGRKVNLIPRHMEPEMRAHVDESLAAASALLRPSVDTELTGIYHYARDNGVCLVMFSPTERLPEPPRGLVARWVDPARWSRDSYLVSRAADKNQAVTWWFEAAESLLAVEPAPRVAG